LGGDMHRPFIEAQFQDEFGVLVGSQDNHHGVEFKLPELGHALSELGEQMSHTFCHEVSTRLLHGYSLH
jgi:hypothetical protein